MDGTRGSLPRCSNCGTEIPWRPVRFQGRLYCCGGCAQGGPCYCSYDLPRIPHPPNSPRPFHGRGGSKISPLAAGEGDRAGEGWQSFVRRK